jgi:hypothetical protein
MQVPFGSGPYPTTQSRQKVLLEHCKQLATFVQERHVWLDKYEYVVHYAQVTAVRQIVQFVCVQTIQVVDPPEFWG